MKKQMVHFPTIAIVGWIGMFLLLYPLKGRSSEILLPDCSPLPEREPARMISLYVAKAQDQPGFVCARMINGIGRWISIAPRFKLQK